MRESKHGEALVRRRLTQKWFTKIKKNGESVVRDWLIYSPSSGSVFCFVCKLFSHRISPFVSGSGFSNWKHPEFLYNHGSSDEHHKCMLMYIQRRQRINHIDANLLNQIETERGYWRTLLKRIVSVVKFLSSRGLFFEEMMN